MRRPPCIKQQDITDCGAACLASVAAWHGLKIPLARIRQYASTDRNGTNLLGMIEAADKLGLLAKGVKAQSESISQVPLPAIAHLKLESGLLHYVVVYKVNRENVFFMDPADGGLHKIPAADFHLQWTGILILLVPLEIFRKGNEKVSLVERFLQLIRPQTGLIIQSLAGAAIYSILGLGISVYVQQVIDNILPGQNRNLLNLLSISMITILIFRIFIGVFKSIYIMKAGQQIDGSLILGYYKHLLHMPQRFFDTMRTGELISRINDAVKIRQLISSVAIELVVNCFILLTTLIFILFISWNASVILFFMIPVCITIYSIFNYLNKINLRKVMERSADLESQLVESLNGISTIKNIGLEQFSFNRTESSFMQLLISSYRTGKQSIVASHATSLVTGLGTIILLWTGSLSVFQQNLTPGELMLLYTLFGYLLGPLSSLIHMNRSLQDALIAADRLFQILDLDRENTSEEHHIQLSPEGFGSIQVEQVSFRYGSRNDVFDKLTMTIWKGEVIALVGESGCGKSTFASLLLRNYTPQSGRICLDHIDLQDFSKNCLREKIGIVPQKIDLFSGNFIDNIAPGDSQPDLHKILNLCEQVGLASLIRDMPDRLHSPLVEQGTNLSGGERQKIALARALYRDPEILILDEATSSLDSSSEQHVLNIIRDFKERGKTVILIAHRMNTVRLADRIICIKNGKVHESGTHEDLIKNEDHYYTLYKYQNNLFIPSLGCTIGFQPSNFHALEIFPIYTF